MQEKLFSNGIMYSLALAIVAASCAFALGRAIKAAMDGMSRQPEVAGKIQTAMIVGCAFIEALTIYVLISIFLIPNR